MAEFKFPSNYYPSRATEHWRKQSFLKKVIFLRTRNYNMGIFSSGKKMNKSQRRDKSYVNALGKVMPHFLPLSSNSVRCGKSPV